jgi:hypothetical protein
MKHNKRYGFYIISQDLIDFLHGDGSYKNRSLNDVDNNIYTHYNEKKLHSDKYIGIIVEFQKYLYFAPITHDGDKK